MFGHPAARGTQEVQGVCAISSGALCTPRQVCWLFFFPFPCLSPHLLRVKTSDSCWLIIIQEHWPIIDQDHLHSPLGVCLLPQDQKKKKKKRTLSGCKGWCSLLKHLTYQTGNFLSSRDSSWWRSVWALLDVVQSGLHVVRTCSS